MSSKNPYVEQINSYKESLAVDYMPAVKAMATRLKERLPSSVDFNDLVSIGLEELVKLAKRYDSSLNDNFWGYAKQRVQGGMLDYLRSLDIVSRASRKLIKAIDYAIEEYMLLNEGEPTDEELSNILNESIEKIHDARIASHIYTVMPLHDQLQIGDEGAALAKIEKEELKIVI